MADMVRPVVAALADLVPAEPDRSSKLAVPTEWFRWLEADAVRLFTSIETGFDRSAQPFGGLPAREYEQTVSIDQRFGEQLASVDQVRPEQHSLRVGWLFVAGRSTDGDDRVRKVFHPLVTMPVTVKPALGFGSARITPAGDPEVSDLITDRATRFHFESQLQFGGGALEGLRSERIPTALLGRLNSLDRFAQAAAEAAAFGPAPLGPVDAEPDALTKRDGLRIVAGLGIFATHATTAAGRAGSLREWSTQSLKARTAFHALYADPTDPTDDAPTEAGDVFEADVRSPFVLTPRQRDTVVEARSAPVTVISGAPGTGKSHTVTAIACDALARGESVLVAARNDATVDALLDLLERSPGPDPVVFGSNERRVELAEQLAAGQVRPIPNREVRHAHDTYEAAADEADRCRRDIAARLTAIELAGDDTRVRQRHAASFGSDVDLDRVESLLRDVRRPASSWWQRWKQHRRRRKLTRLAGAHDDVDLATLVEAAQRTRAERMAARALPDGSLASEPDQWVELDRLETVARDAMARWLAADSRSASRLDRSTLPTLAALSTALRSGRAARRSQLARLDERLTKALPLWVGSLPDIDELLPTVPAVFDLVILDEASSIDQPLAATALLRARRAVVVGDPRQLRHVSFLSGERINRTLHDHGIDTTSLLASRLDVRRNSVFDVATGVSPVITLDEHFRSDPHLVEFVADRLYDGSVKIATRRPTTTERCCIGVVHVDGHRDDAKVVRAEVERAIKTVTRLRGRGARSVGIITPFRARADAIEEAALAAFSLADLEALDLRVGTVHEFQGNERDVIVAAIGIGPDETANSWRFVEDPHLFAVLATRARRTMKVLTSATPPPGGLIADYLAHADHPPREPALRPVEEWVERLADDLTAGGADVRVGYPAGRHTVDVCVVGSQRDLAIVCGVHRDGAEAHIDRHTSLARHGWTIIEVARARWDNEPAQLVLDLLHEMTT